MNGGMPPVLGLNHGIKAPDSKEFDNCPDTHFAVILRRAKWGQRVTLFYKDGSSDHLTHEEARKKLVSLGSKDPDKPLDHVWNFYSATVLIRKQ